MAMDEADKTVALVISGCLILVVALVVINFVQYGRGDESDSQEKWNLQFVSGTEYSPGQEGQVAVIVIDSTGAPVTDEFACGYTILYPNKTTFQSGSMLANTSIGTQYVTFTVPGDEGVYEYASTCTFDRPDVIIFFGNSSSMRADANITAAKSFHVSLQRNSGLRAVITQ